MESADSDKQEKKRPRVSSPMARNSTTSPANNKPVDAAVLQYKNQQLVQQLDIQKHDLHDLETKIKELKEKQTSYDDVLIKVNQLWNQLVDDLILLGVRAGRGKVSLQTLDRADRSQGTIPSCPAEEIFLCRLLQSDSIPNTGNDGAIKYIGEALALRHSSTRELMKFLEDTIDAHRARTATLAQALHGKLPAEDAIIQLSKIDDLLKDEADNLREVIDVLHLKHKEYANGIQTYIQSDSVDQSEIKRLSGELEESMVELEESRRKFINLKMQKDAACGVHTPLPGPVNGTLSPEKPSDKMVGLPELKDSIEETKILAANRLSEIQEAQEVNLILLKQMQDIENEMKDDKYIHSSRPYVLLNDQLLHYNAEVERYKALTDTLQADKSNIGRRDKDLIQKAEIADTVRNVIDSVESKIEGLEVQLQKCVVDKNDLEIKMEEAAQDAGRMDIKSEFRVMASALSKELRMMEAQLNRWKETAREALSLRGEVQALKALLSTKTNEQKSLADKCAEQMMEIQSLKTLIEKVKKEKLELQIFLDMHGQEGYDNRDIMEIKESERRACSQAEVLRNALDEHSLELRVKAANETEAACQQRLSAAEAEIADLRAKVDASERDVLELTEAIKIKDGEAEAYISEIETIGQAYEDMQSQNQHLLKQVTERDDYNIKLVSESVKTKQAQSFLHSEKQALAKQLQQITTSVQSVKLRIARSEEEMKVCLTETLKFIEEDRHLALNLEIAKWELTDAEKELKWLKSAIASSEKENEHSQRKMDEIKTELDRERSERKKLEEELMEMNGKVAEMSLESREATMQRLQDEIKDCKSILKCGVCFDRPKEVLILKCYHMFCNPCIQRNLEIRHRKCPGCGTAFGQNDVRSVKI